MTARVHLKPGRPGLLVRDPVSRDALPPEGAAKELTTYWRRRLAAGDVLRAEPPVAEPPAQPKKARAAGKSETEV